MSVDAIEEKKECDSNTESNVESLVESNTQSNPESNESKFDSLKHCRYCFHRLENPEENNFSSCLCSGLLCKQCLIRELQLTFRLNNQNNENNNFTHGCHCTVCKHKFIINRSKSKEETQLFPFLKYAINLTFPGKDRDLSVFDRFHWNRIYLNNNRNSNEFIYLLPINISKPIILTMSCWLIFTLLIECIGGYNIGDGRMLCFIIDIYLTIELLRITTYIDFPERKWIILSYLFRFIITSVWCINSYLIEHSTRIDIINHFNWHWLLFYIIETFIFLLLELKYFIKDINLRVISESTKSTNITVKTLKNKIIGPFNVNLAINQENQNQNQNLFNVEIV